MPTCPCHSQPAPAPSVIIPLDGPSAAADMPSTHLPDHAIIAVLDPDVEGGVRTITFYHLRPTLTLQTTAASPSDISPKDHSRANQRVWTPGL